MIRRTLSIAFLLVMIVGGFQPLYFRMLFADREPLRGYLETLRYRKVPGLEPFMQKVRERTAANTRIALAFPWTRWENGYAYAFYRSSYVLAGRRPLPLIGPDNQLIETNLGNAEYVAGWHVANAPDGFEIIWREPQGFLAKRAH